MQDLKVVLRIDAETGKATLEVNELEGQLKGVGESGKKAGDKVSKGMKKAEDSTNTAQEVVKGMRNELVRLASVGFAVKLIKDTIQLADEMKLLDAKIGLVTNSQSAFNTAQEETTRIALETHTAIGTTVDLYTRLERSLQGQSVAQRDVLSITETINQAMGVSGATAQETSSVITQLSQGLAAGVLRGEEFNAVNESGSRIMQALKDDLGKTSGELREMAFAGELTTEIITKALLRQSEKIAAEYAQLPVTVEKSLNDLRSYFSLYAKDLNSSNDITGKLAAGIEFLGKNLETVIKIIAGGVAIRLLAPVLSSISVSAIAASASIGKMSLSMVAARTQATLLSGSVGLLKGGMTLLGGPAGVALLAAYGIYELGSAMIEAASKGDDFKNSIDDINKALAVPLKVSNLESITEKYAKLRLAVNQLTGAIEKQAKVDAIINSQKYIDGVTNLSKAMGRQQQAALGRLTVSESLDKIILKLTKSTENYAKAIKDKETKAIEAANKVTKAKIDFDKETIKLQEEATKLLSQYGTEAERIAIVEQERNERIQEYNIHGELTQSVLDALNKKFDTQIKKLKGVSKELENQNGLWDDYEKLLKDLGLIDDVEASFLALEIRIEDIAKEMNLSAAETDVLREAVRKLRLEADGDIDVNVNVNSTKGFSNKDSFRGLLDDGNTLVDIFNRAGEGLNEGIQSAANSMNVLLEGAQFLSDVWNSHSGQDSVGQVLNSISDVAATGALGPVAQAIAQVANTINGLTGGRLFGTSYQLDSTALNVDLANGGSGGTTTSESRQRSLFRGTQRREVFDALVGDALAAIQEISRQRDIIAEQTAIALGTTAAELVNATFQQVYDKDGNLQSSKSVINGVTYNDQTIQEFASRTYSEQIIAGLAGALPLVQKEVTNYFNNFEREFTDGMSSFSTTSLQWVDEVNFLADTFRNQGVEALADFAQFALQAVVDIKNGSGILDSLTNTLSITQELQIGNDSLLQTYQRLVAGTQLTSQALETMGISLGLAQDDFVRFSDGIVQAAGGLDQAATLWNDFFNTFYTPEELTQRSLETSSQLLGQQATDLGIDPTITAEEFRALFEAQTAAGNLTAEQVVQWLQFGQTLGRVNTLIDETNQAELDRVATLNQAITEYNNFGNSIRRQIDDINGVNNSLTDIRAVYQSNIASLNDLARAAGLAGASDRDLADAHELYVAQIRQATQALFDQLYGDNLDARIAELEAQQTGVINNVSTASNGLFDAWTRAIDNLRDYTKSRLVDSFSPLEAKDRLAQAQSDLFAAVNAANNGDLAAAQSLPGLADTVDQLNRAVNASGSDYNDIFYAIQNALDGVNAPNGISNNIVGGNFGGGVSPELQALYDERDARLATQTTQNRLELATQLAQHLNALATAINQPLFAIADEMGLSLNNLVSDLGVDLNALTAASVQSLGNISNLLGVNLTDLAQNLGEDVSFALGSLADAQSLLNDALEGTIGNLPTEYTELLTPLLRDVENAADGTAQEQALQALSFETGKLPAEYRNLLAPYFTDIDPTTELQDALNEAQTQTAVLIDIRDLLLNAPLPGPGDPAPNPLSSDINKDPIPIAQTKPLQVVSDPALITRVDELNAEMANIRRELRKISSSNDNIAENTTSIAETNEDLATSKPIVTQPRIVAAR
jgi:tape measure domain-containing protein